MKRLFFAACLAVAPVAFAHGPDDNHEHVTTASIAQTERVILGSGEHTFETVPDWIAPPEGDQYGATHGSAAVDSEGNVYISLDSNRFGYGIAVYNAQGEFIRGIAEGVIGLHSLAFHEEDGTGYLYGAQVSGDMGAVKLTLDGEVVYRRVPPEDQRGGRYRPTAVAVAPNGDVYLADGYGSNYIFQWDSEGNFIRRFGERGTGNGQFRTCHGIAVDTRHDEPRLLICDRENRRLQYFTLDGEFISVSTTGLRRPCAVKFHGDNAAVAELAGRAVILDIDNEVISVLGDQPVEGFRANFRVSPDDWVQGVFNAPHGLAYTNDGDLIIAEWNAQGRMTYLRRIPADEAPAETASAE